jgi:drug/metabolite transporter (DMT)-like permease
MNRVLFPLMTSVLFSGSYIAGKYTTVDLGPLTTTLLRYLIALIFLSGLLFHYKSSALKLRRRDIVPALILGLTGIVGYHYFFFLSLRYTEVANTAIINALSPVLTSVAAALFIHERLSRKNYVGVIIAFLGVLVLLSRGDIDAVLAVRFNKGDLLMCLSVVSWMVYALLIRTMVDRYSGFTLTYYATLFGVVLLLFLTPSEGPLSQIREISRASLLSVLYMGICGSGLGYLLYNLSIREIGPTRTSSFVYSVIPLIVAVLALMFFQQPITPIMVASMVLILIGLRLMLAVTPRSTPV